MDNIVYTSAAALMLGIFYSAVRRMHILYISNTQLIMRQSDQIQFVLIRVIELDKKIRKIREEMDDITNINDSIDASVLDTIQEDEAEEEDKDEDEELLTETTEEEKENDLSQTPEVLPEEKEKEKEISFEIVESTPIKTRKEQGWIRYLF